MATITTDTYLDGGTARTAGEAWTCNGGRLKIRTDSRWHANAPASMTGSLGSVTVSTTLGGGYNIDATKVRWMPYNTGSGNVPAIGTTVTQGGVSGYLLGVWASITAAPTAVGAAIPTTGFLKFREVTGGPYAAGALTGIGASATGPDVVGWLEVVHDQSANITVPRLGSFVTRGDWFELAAASGSANQLVQLPTNGSATAYVPGVWIATTDTPLTDNDWEFYPALFAGGMLPADLGVDERSKFVCMETNGAVRIGHNGTAVVGYVPPLGRRIRVPNIFGRQCTTAARATNAFPHSTFATRPEFAVSGAGAIDMEFFLVDWYLLFSQPYSVKMHHCALFDLLPIFECATAPDVWDGGMGVAASLSVRSLNVVSCFAGGRIEKFKAHRYMAAAAGPVVEINYCSGIWNLDIDAGVIAYTRSARYAYQFTGCSGLRGKLRATNQQVVFSYCTDTDIENIDYIDRYVGGTTTVGPMYAFLINTACNGVVIRSVTFGLNGLIPNCHPYTAVFTVAQSQNITVRGLGSRTAFASGGSANSPGYIYQSGGNNRNVRVQRCYLAPTRTGAMATNNADTDCLYEHVYGDFADLMTMGDLNSTVRNCGGATATAPQTAVYGSHFMTAFTSDTVGRLSLSLNEPTAKTLPLTSQLFSVGSGFTSAGGVSLIAVGDFFTVETDGFQLQTTGFVNSAPAISAGNIGSHSFEYQIDTGSGWNGTWKTLNGANLSGETVDPTVGYRLKIKIECLSANPNNLVTFVRVETTSTLLAQTENLYPLDTNTITFTGLPTGTEVRIRNGSKTLSTTPGIIGSAYSYTYSADDRLTRAQFTLSGYEFEDVDFYKYAYNQIIPVAWSPDPSYIY